MSPEVYFSGLHTALADLYSAETFTLTAEGVDMPPFDDELFVKAAEYIRTHGGYDASMLKTRPVRDLIDAIYGIFRQAIERGIGRKTPSIVTDTLGSNAFIFSGLKVNNSLMEVGLSLTDSNGHIKPFETFLKEVKVINNMYNHNYLRAEYNHAVASAQITAKWYDFKEDGDDYDLQYRTSGDEKVRESHRLLDGITLAFDDPFWDRYMPPNGWNCRCTVVQVKKGKYRRDDSKKVMELGDAMTDSPKLKIFRFNAGKELSLFPKKHPYFKAPEEVLEQIDIAEMRARAKEIRAQARESLIGKTFSNKDFGKPIIITNKGIKEWLNQPHKHKRKKDELLLDMGNIIKKATYLGFGEDKHNKTIISHIFEYKIDQDKTWIIVREFHNGICQIHSISDGEKILNILKNKTT